MASDHNFVTNSSGKSKVWTNFGFVKEGNTVDKKHVGCKICGTILKYSGNTTNLFDHMRRKHCCSDGGTRTHASFTAKTSPPKKQVKLNFTMDAKLPVNSHRSLTISKAILDFIIMDLRPFSVVSSPGFRKLLHILEPSYTIPSRQYFSEIALRNKYEETKQHVSAELRLATHVSLTTDDWTSRATQSYITITATQIDDDWNLQNYVLQTRAMPEAHTGQNIAAVLKQGIEDWDLARNTTPSLVTDNAANMYVAAREAEFKIHIGCFAHVLNLSCGKALKVETVSKLLVRFRRIVGFFHRSTTAAALLREKQISLNLAHHKLIIDCPTRWNSAVDMMDRFLEQQPAVIASLTSKELRGKCDDSYLLEKDITSAEELLSVLTPLKTATVALCEEKVPTLSIVLPLQQQLLNNILATNADDTKFVKDVKKAVSLDLEKRYAEEKVRSTLRTATILDPRFKSGPFLTDSEKLSTYQLITLEAVEMLKQFETKSKSLVKVKTEPVPDLPNLPVLQSDNMDVEVLPPSVKTEVTGQPSIDAETASATDGNGKCVESVDKLEDQRKQPCQVCLAACLLLKWSQQSQLL